MDVKTISLKNFRNLKDINIELNNGINIFLEIMLREKQTPLNLFIYVPLDVLKEQD